MNTGKLQGNNDGDIFVGRSSSVHSLLFTVMHYE